MCVFLQSARTKSSGETAPACVTVKTPKSAIKQRASARRAAQPGITATIVPKVSVPIRSGRCKKTALLHRVFSI